MWIPSGGEAKPRFRFSDEFRVQEQPRDGFRFDAEKILAGAILVDKSGKKNGKPHFDDRLPWAHGGLPDRWGLGGGHSKYHGSATTMAFRAACSRINIPDYTHTGLLAYVNSLYWNLAIV